MKATLSSILSNIMIIALLAGGLFVSGCSGSNDASKTGQADTSITEGLDEQPANPDIGTLDNIPVSDELPQ